jgi:hypothetical protein
MNKTGIMLFLLSSIIISCNQNEIKKRTLPEITASFTEEVITIDGSLIESVWKYTEPVALRDNKTGSRVSDSTCQTQVETAYDSTYLYISFLCHDQDIWGTFTDRDQHLWTEEAVEVFIDTDTVLNTYVEIEVSPMNVLFDSYIVDPVIIDIEATKKFDLAGISTAVSVNGTVNEASDQDTKWSVEIAIPLKELVEEQEKIIPGKTVWRINFYRIERKRTGESTGYAWSPTGARFHKPAAFGILSFGKKIKTILPRKNTIKYTE